MSSDEELFLDGGDTAMTQLVGRFERPLFRFLFQLTNDAQLAEDIFQECFLRLHRSRGAYRHGQPLKPYLYRIALNAFHDTRTKRGRPTVSLDDPAPLTSPPSPLSCEERGSDVSERTETKDQLRAALASLPENEREVVVLRVFEDLTFQEIARIQDIPVPTAKSRMLYALRRMRPALERYMSGANKSAGILPARNPNNE